MKKQRFLFTLLMAIVMMAFSPQRVWAQEEGGDPDPGYEVPDDGSQECQHETLYYEHYESNVHQELCYTCGHCLQEEKCSFVNGKCTKCNYECGHDKWNDSQCTVCGLVCNNHTYNTDGKCNTCGITTDIVSVTIGSNVTNYRSLSDALTAALNADAATITLLQNFTFTQDSPISISQGNVTLDLNGHKISAIRVDGLNLSGGSLTIMDSGNTGEINTTGGNAVYATGGTITIHGGTFKSKNGPALQVDNSTVNVSIDGGQFVGNIAIILKSKSALAFGYSYYISGTDTELTDVTNGPVSTSNGIVPDVTVKPATVKGTLTIGGETTNYYHFNTAFSEALDAASATIKMLKDVDLLNGQAPYSLNMDRGNLTLDLNGHTISSSGPNTLNLSGGSLTIKDSSVGKTGTMKTSGSYALNVTGGSVTIQGGTFSASSYALNITSSNVTASLEGGVFKASGGGGINNQSGKSILADGYAFYNSNDNELPERTNGTILEGNYPAKDITVKPATVKGTLTIGGETTNYYDFKKAFDDALEASSATITMLGDVSLSSSLTVDKGNVTLDLNGHTISTSGPNTLNLSGGSFTIKDSSVGKTGTMKTSGSYALNVTGGSVTIQGGTFSASSYALNITSSNVTASLEGGVFKASSGGINNESGKSILADGYAFYNSNDDELPERTNGTILEGNYPAKDITVKPATVKGTLTIGGETTNYYHFNTAFSEALDAESATIKMMKDVDLLNGQAPYSLNMDRGNLTLDLNGHTISSSGPNTLNLSGGSLTIKDSSVGKTGTMETSGSSALNVTGGSITIQGGTFSASGYALNITSSNVTASLECGIFKANTCGIYNQSGKSILADGYAFYNSIDEELPERTTGYILEGNYPAKDITVKPATVKATLTIGGETTNYYDLGVAFGKALDAGSAVTMTILKDFDLVIGASTYSLDMDRGNLTLDLNGHTINQPIGGTVLNISGGEFIIVDTSNDKTGTIKTDGGSALRLTGGSITIHDGTFSGADGPALYISQDATAFIDGGIFISSKGSAPAIENHSGRSILANGYALYNADDVELQETVNGSIWDGNSTAKYIIVKAIPVASVTTSSGTVEYTDIIEANEAAVNAGEPATITLLQDFTTQYSSITISQGNVTLDLNGHTIKQPNGNEILKLSGGSLTIVDSSVGKTGLMQINGGYALNVTGGSLTIHGGTFCSYSSALYITSTNVTASLDGGIFKANISGIYNESGKSILAEGYSFYSSNNELDEVVNGALWDGNSPALDITVKRATVKGTLTIGGVTTDYYNFNTAFSQALDAESATMQIQKDVDLVNGSSTYSLDMSKGNLTLDLNGHTINKPRGGNVLNQSGGELTIIDSSVGKTGTMQTVGSSALNVTGGAITIHGGTFKAGSGIAFYVANSTVNVSIDGGQFVGSSAIYLGGKSALAFGYSYYISGTDTELSDVTSGFVMTSNGDAKDITVKPATVKGTLTIGSETTNYYDFKIAFNKALDAESAVTMKILKDVNVFSVNGSKSNPLEFNKGNVTIDLNGHRIYQSNSGTVMNMSAGSLTIIDSSEDKTGKMDTDAGYIFGVSGGSLTVRGGTFTTGSATLFVDDNADVTVSLEGGRFQSGAYTAILNRSSKSILADGFAFYNALTGIKLYASSGEMKDEDGNFAHDVIVECDHEWENSVCSKCGKVCKHNFYDWSECKICGYWCTHEGAECDQENPASGHYCKTCGLSDVHYFENSVCSVCGYQCVEHDWDKFGCCTICGIECAHQFDANDHCTVCGVTKTVSATIGGESKKYVDINTAIEAAQNAGKPATITLLQDVVDEMTVYDDDDITLDLNGHTFAGDYTTVIKVYGGSLTITDNSAEKAGKVVHSYGIIGAYGGSLTIHAGTFESYGYSALHIESDAYYAPLTVSIDGGRFITNGETSAIYTKGVSALAPNCGYIHSDNGKVLSVFVDNLLVDDNGNPAKDVTVKPLVIDALDLADATTYDGKNAGCKVTDFTYTRDFGGTNWTTWYVPFDLVLTDEICQKLAFSRINNVHQYDDDENGVPDRTVIESFRQKAGVTLRANYPYLVKALNDADRNIELHLSNVTLAPAAENSIDCQSVDYIYTFTGTYAGMGDSGLNSDSPYSLNDTYWDNNWYHFQSLEPQRHYMVIEPTNGGQAPRNIKVRLNVAGEEDATGIVTLYSDKEKMQDEVEVYDLMGRKLNSNSTQRGLHIQNGKVIFNK